MRSMVGGETEAAPSTTLQAVPLPRKRAGKIGLRYLTTFFGGIGTKPEVRAT